MLRIGLFVGASLAVAGCGGKETSTAQDRALAATRGGRETLGVAAGDFVTHSTNTSVKQLGSKLLVSQNVTFDVTGGLSGSATAHDSVLLDRIAGTGSFFGFGTFVGAILGRSGSIDFVYAGTFAGYPALPQLTGRIFFLPETGTGQLAGVSGEGMLQGILDVSGTYSVELFFDSSER
jgi:hypothetical protein